MAFPITVVASANAELSFDPGGCGPYAFGGNLYQINFDRAGTQTFIVYESNDGGATWVAGPNSSVIPTGNFSVCQGGVTNEKLFFSAKISILGATVVALYTYDLPSLTWDADIISDQAQGGLTFIAQQACVWIPTTQRVAVIWKTDEVPNSTGYMLFNPAGASWTATTLFADPELANAAGYLEMVWGNGLVHIMGMGASGQLVHASSPDMVTIGPSQIVGPTDNVGSPLAASDALLVYAAAGTIYTALPVAVPVFTAVPWSPPAGFTFGVPGVTILGATAWVLSLADDGVDLKLFAYSSADNFTLAAVIGSVALGAFLTGAPASAGNDGSVTVLFCFAGTIYFWSFTVTIAPVVGVLGGAVASTPVDLYGAFIGVKRRKEC